MDKGLTTASDTLFGKTPTTGELAKKAGEFKSEYLKEGLRLSDKDAIALATKQLTPGSIRTYGPSLALAGAAALGLGALDDPEDLDEAARIEAERRFAEASSPSRKNALLESDPGSYVVDDLDPYKYRPAPNPRSYSATIPVNFALAAAPPPYLQNSPDYARYNAAGGGFIDGQPQYLNYGPVSTPRNACRGSRNRAVRRHPCNAFGRGICPELPLRARGRPHRARQPLPGSPELVQYDA
jgi:hypothetical protein